MASKPLVVHLCGSCRNGGAARGAYRIHQSLDKAKVNSVYRTLDSPLDSDDSVVSGPIHKSDSLVERIKYRLRCKWQTIVQSRSKEYGAGIRSYANIPYGITNEAIINNADVIHLHWIARHFMSIEEIGKINKPTVWTLHDMWPFCGAEHYATSEQYKDGYLHTSRPKNDTGVDLNRQTWERKKKAWVKPIHIVATSQWMADCAKSSMLMREWPISIIPCPIDTETWKPINQTKAREILDLPLKQQIIAVAADGQFTNHDKGGDLLLEALSMLPEHINPILLIIGDNKNSKNLLPKRIEPEFTGKLNDIVSMRLAYAASDVVVVPSRKEAFGQVASEAHSCGRPVAAFAASGILDIVEHQKTGHLAKPYEPKSLAKSIEWIISNSDRWHELCSNARSRAEKLWSYEKTGAKYAELYKNVIALYSGTTKN